MKKTPSDAAVKPVKRRNGRNANLTASSWKAVFQRLPQNSANDVERRGLHITGMACTPALRQTSESRWNTPKCSAKTKPLMPIQPARSGYRGRAVRATNHVKLIPTIVFTPAPVHSREEGL